VSCLLAGIAMSIADEGKAHLKAGGAGGGGRGV